MPAAIRPVLLSAIAFWSFTIAIIGNETVTAEPPETVPYEKQITEWRKEHETTFASETGWLALAGHDWLKDGENRFGSQPDNLIVLPMDAAAKIAGTITLSESKVTITAAEGTNMLFNNVATNSGTFKIGEQLPDENSPDVVLINDRFRLQLVRRSGKLAIRTRDPKSKTRTEFTGKKWFDVDPTYRVEAKYTSYPLGRTIKITNSRGDTVDAEVPGYVEFVLHGKQCRLDAQVESDTELLFTFKDTTNKSTTYQPGRFLVTHRPEGDKLILDFNQAHNPPCAFSKFTMCPMPPKQNHLDIAIEAGEKRYNH